MKSNVLIFVSLVICFIILGFLYLDRSGYFKPRNEAVKTDTVFTTKTDTLWKDTTIVEKEIVPKYIVKKKVDTVYTKEGDTLNLITESKRFDKTIISNKDTADVQVYTSGVNTSLDSLKMRFKAHHEVITNTVEITKYIEKPKTFWKRFHIQPQVTGGYDIINKQFGITAGVGVGVDL